MKYYSWIFLSSVCYGNDLTIPESLLSQPLLSEPFYLISELNKGEIPHSFGPSVIGGEPVVDLDSPVYKSTVRILASGVVAAPAPGLEGRTISWRCSGVYLTDMAILTAAHCAPALLSYSFEGKSYSAKLEKHKYEVFSVIKAGQKEFSGVKVTRTVRHPNFVDLWYTKMNDAWNPKSEIFDLALMKLEYPLAYEKAPVSRVAEIPESKETLIIAGYGKNNPSSEFDVPELRQALAPFNQKLLNGTDFVVGRGSFAKPGKVSEPVGGCTGDSGGPIYQDLMNGTLAVVGLISRGPDETGGGCLSSLTIATGVWPYKAWIENTLLSF